MQNIIITTCGTSILTSGEDRDIVELITRYANEKEIYNEKIISHIEKCKEKILNMTPLEVQKKSAELKSIVKYYNENMKNKKDFHILITTDTYLGKKTGEIVKEWLEKYNFSVMLYNQKDLSTKSIEEFHIALTELARFLTEIIPAYKNLTSKIIFNLTGGFKAVQGFMQVFAMLYGDETIYIFEASDELLRIPKIPIKINEEILKENISIIRRLSLGLTIKKEELKKIPDLLIDNIGDEFSISVWGVILWEKIKDKIYENELLEPPSEKIKYSKSFKSNINSLPKNRIKEINKRIDELALFLEKKQNLKSLNFHSIEGNPLPPCTHEFYAWSDEDAKRVYGYFDGEVFMCEKLGKHL